MNGRSVVSLLLAVAAIFLGGPAAHGAEPFPISNQLGTSLGLPAGVNLEYVHEFGRRAIYVAGGYWGRPSHGAQVGVGLVRGGKPRAHYALELVAGRFHWRPSGGRSKEWTYAGLEVYLKYRDFFVAPSLTTGDGTWSDDASRQTVILGSLRFGLVSAF